MRKCLFPGSFDPVTNGHMDLIERLDKMYDLVCVCVQENKDKNPLFTPEQRVELIKEACKAKGLSHIEVVRGHGFTVDMAREVGAQVMARGIRSVTDMEYEAQIEKVNHFLAPQIETVFLLAKGELNGISSSMVKQIYSLGGDVSPLVPACVTGALYPNGVTSRK